VASKKVPALDSLKATVRLDMNGAQVEIGNVSASSAFVVLAEMLDARRDLLKKYPEILPILEPVPGGSIPYTEEDGFDVDPETGRRRMGFR
jgi:hypothetical protein